MPFPNPQRLCGSISGIHEFWEEINYIFIFTNLHLKLSEYLKTFKGRVHGFQQMPKEGSFPKDQKMPKKLCSKVSPYSECYDLILLLQAGSEHLRGQTQLSIGKGSRPKDHRTNLTIYSSVTCLTSDSLSTHLQSLVLPLMASSLVSHFRLPPWAAKGIFLELRPESFFSSNQGLSVASRIKHQLLPLAFWKHHNCVTKLPF